MVYRSVGVDQAVFIELVNQLTCSFLPVVKGLKAGARKYCSCSILIPVKSLGGLLGADDFISFRQVQRMPG